MFEGGLGVTGQPQVATEALEPVHFGCAIWPKGGGGFRLFCSPRFGTHPGEGLGSGSLAPGSDESTRLIHGVSQAHSAVNPATTNPLWVVLQLNIS